MSRYQVVVTSGYTSNSGATRKSLQVEAGVYDLWNAGKPVVKMIKRAFPSDDEHTRKVLLREMKKELKELKNV